MKVPLAAADESPSMLGQPLVLILLIIVLGAVVYLRQKRYIRRRTSQVLIAILALVLVLVAWQLYRTS